MSNSSRVKKQRRRRFTITVIAVKWKPYPIRRLQRETKQRHWGRDPWLPNKSSKEQQLMDGTRYCTDCNASSWLSSTNHHALSNTNPQSRCHRRRQNQSPLPSTIIPSSPTTTLHKLSHPSSHSKFPHSSSIPRRHPILPPPPQILPTSPPQTALLK